MTQNNTYFNLAQSKKTADVITLDYHAKHDNVQYSYRGYEKPYTNKGFDCMMTEVQLMKGQFRFSS